MAKYMIPNEFPSDLYDFAKPQARAHWTSYPTYSYEQFYRTNPRGKHNPADPKARYKALQAVADDERANENERKIARRLMSKMEAEGLVKPKKAKKNGTDASNWWMNRMLELDREVAALEAKGAKVPKALLDELAKAAKAYKREAARGGFIGRANPSKAHHARRNSGEPIFIPVAGNAGRFTPNIFPYGVGGRPAIYPTEAAAKNNPRTRRNPTEYRYGAQNRPPGYATVPSGYIRVEAGISPSERRTRHGVVVYDRPLTQDEIESYELRPYMPLAEVVDRIVSGMDYGAEYAEFVREEGDEALRPNVGDALDRKLPIYTDVPLDEVHKHVARELLRRFPAGAKNNPRPGKYKSVLEAGGKFAIPEKAPREGSFPIDTIKRARYALALVAAPAFDANPTTRQRVIKAVVAEYPQLRTEADHVLDRVVEREGRSKRAAANPRRHHSRKNGSSEPYDVARTLRVGDQIEVEYEPPTRTAVNAKRKLTVTAVNHPYIYVTSGRVRPGHLGGGAIRLVDMTGEVSYQPTPQQQVRDVYAIRRLSEHTKEQSR